MLFFHNILIQTLLENLILNGFFLHFDVHVFVGVV